MNSPNLQQRIYLAKALNENTDTLFDHPEMNEARRRGVPFSKTEAQLRKENMAAGKAWLAKKGLVKKGKKAPSDKNAEKKQEETNEESISEGVRRMRRLRRAHVSGKASRKTADAYDKELSKLSASRLRRGGARKQTIRAFFTDKPTTPAADKAYERFTKGAMQKANAKGKKIFEDMDLDEGSYVHSKGQLKKAIKGSKRNIVKAMRKGDKKEASFWMQNKKDAEEQLKEASASVPAWRKEDWVFDLPNSTVRELKAKHGKHLAQINAGSAAPKGLRKSIHTILQKHQIPNLMANPRHSIDAVMSSFHTYHSDPQISANDIYTSRRAARAAGKALKEGSLGQKRVKRVFKSKRDDMKFQDSTIAKTRNLVTRKVLRAGADPRDVATRMKDSSANLRTLNALQRFNDEARLKSKYPALRKK